jgi:uncharacterized protein YndB with AHSA1/START domain
MTTRSIVRELTLPLDVAAAFALLHTPSAIRAWWSAARVIVVPRLHGLWIATWGADEDAPDYITAARIAVWDPPHRMQLADFEYETRDAEPLPFAVAALSTELTVEPRGNGSLLRVEQRGFPTEPSADAFFASCERGWTATLEGIARVASR